MIGVSRGPSCGASRDVSLAHPSSPIPGSEGSPRVGLARGKSAGQASLYASLAYGVKGAGRRVCGGLPPGTGAVWFLQRGVSRLPGVAIHRIGPVLRDFGEVAAHAASCPAASSWYFWRSGSRIAPR